MLYRENARITVGVVALLAVLGVAAGVQAEVVESQRLERAKDFIADEQWLRAMQELKAAADDPKEANKDEALFWLAHSQNQARDSVAALETISRLERGFPKSRWAKPARSLGLEIAQRLGRRDVLWFTATPPVPAAPPMAPPATTAPPAPAPPAPPGARPPRIRAPRAARPAEGAELPPPPPGAHGGRQPVPPSALPPPPPGWGHLVIDTDLRIQALGSLIKTDAVKVIPMLKQIALEAENPGEARRALFVLAQSGRPEARSTVVEVARTGSEPVRLAAVRELGRLSGPGISNELLQVYSSGNGPVKYQVVTALGERAATTALMRIAESESDARLRNAAIVTLGQAGGRDQLNVLYRRSNAESKRPIIVGLFNAQADEELIRIAETERDASIRQEVITTLRLLNTRRAQEYLQKAKRK
jgi:hypothetical protein